MMGRTMMGPAMKVPARAAPAATAHIPMARTITVRRNTVWTLRAQKAHNHLIINTYTIIHIMLIMPIIARMGQKATTASTAHLPPATTH
jgi:hypothetical protein